MKRISDDLKRHVSSRCLIQYSSLVPFASADRHAFFFLRITCLFFTQASWEFPLAIIDLYTSTLELQFYCYCASQEGAKFVGVPLKEMSPAWINHGGCYRQQLLLPLLFSMCCFPCLQLMNTNWLYNPNCSNVLACKIQILWINLVLGCWNLCRGCHVICCVQRLVVPNGDQHWPSSWPTAPQLDC